MVQKRAIAVILCVCMMLSFMTPMANAEGGGGIFAKAESGESIQVTAVNRAIGAADEMILFTRDNSSQLTDTNAFSAAAIADYKDGKYILSEIAVRQGAVKIPYNGFVLFGHGISETWIINNLKPGEEVTIEGYTLPEPKAGQSVSVENGEEHGIDGVDIPREDGKLTIYTINYGKNTAPFGAGTAEAVIANGIVAEKNTDGSNGTYIPENGYVISGSGTTGSAIEFVNGLEVGQKVTLANLTVPTLPAMYFRINGLLVTIDKKNTGRGANEVILYEPSYGATTGNNEWGLEITVVDGKVTAIALGYPEANNSPIPENGCVLSVQSGSPFKSQLAGSVAVGDHVEISTSNALMYNAGKTSFDAFNPKSQEDNPAGCDANGEGYPGFRGTNQLIVYDDTYGSSTGTNQYGYEVVADKNNFIIKVGGNDSVIPEGGYVLSGHGTNADWLKKYAVIGSTVTVDRSNKTVLVLFTPTSMVDRADIKINSAKEELQASREKFLDVPYEAVQQYISAADSLMQDAREELNQKNYQQLTIIIEQIEENTDKAHFANFQSKKVETRAVWIRPKEKNMAEVREHLAQLKDLNINTIYVESWWNGYTIFPTDNEITELNPMYNGFDVLAAYLETAHEMGMEVHCWVENFFVGVSNDNEGGPVRDKKPEWSLISRQGDDYQYVAMYNINYYFANPALPEVRDFVMDIYTEMVSKYDVDGLQLDYVRYPDLGDGTNDFGYDDYTRALFKQANNGADPIDIFPGDPLWETWCDFRANIINTFVYRVTSEMRELKPEIQISADVWPNYEAGPVTLMQEPKDWVSKGYIDNIVPMSYGTDLQSIREDVKNTLDFSKGHAYATIGLGAMTGLSNEMLAGQIQTAHENGADGIALFEFESLMSVGYGKWLKEGLFRDPAMVEHANPLLSVQTIVNDIVRKTTDIYLPNSGIDTAEATALTDKLSAIPNIANHADGGINLSEAEDSQKFIREMIQWVALSENMKEEVKNRIKTDLTYCDTILNNHINHESFKVLTDITTPAAITGVENGTAKTADALGLPKTLAAATSGGSIEVSVDWDVAGTSYSPSTRTEQTFSVTGTVILPRGVVNPSNIPLTVSVDVTVKAGTSVTPPIDSGSGNGTGTGTTAPDSEINVAGGWVTATTTVKATVDTAGNAVTAIPEGHLADIIAKAEAEAAKQGKAAKIAINIQVDAPADAKTVGVELSKGLLTQWIDSKADFMTVSTSIGTMTIDRTMVKNIMAEAAGAVAITGTKVDNATLPAETRKQIGDRPVVSFDISSGDKSVSPVGKMTATIPYTLRAGENPNAVIVSYINGEGKLETIANGIYDSATRSISFKAENSAKFTVGYNQVNFNDVANNAWYQHAVTFAAARGITGGTGNGKFAPDTTVTRAQALVMIMKAFGITEDMDAVNNFSDAGNTYYTGYLAAAKKLGITSGVGNNNFAPDRQVTRQDMFVLVHNTLKNMNELPAAAAVKDLADFKDAGNVSDYAKAATELFVNAGIISGSNDHILPADSASRAQFVQILYNIMMK